MEFCTSNKLVTANTLLTIQNVNNTHGSKYLYIYIFKNHIRDLNFFQVQILSDIFICINMNLNEFKKLTKKGRKHKQNLRKIKEKESIIFSTKNSRVRKEESNGTLSW